MSMKATMILFMFTLSACVVDNRSAVDETELGAVDVDRGIDQGQIPDLAMSDAAFTPQTCEKEDDLFGVEPAVVEVGFSRDDLYLCEGTLDRFRLSGSGESILIKLSAVPIENDLDLTILDEDGNVLAESTGETGDENLVFRFDTQRSSAIIQVSGYQGVSSGYALSIISTCQSDGDCPSGFVCNREFGVCDEDVVVDCGQDAFEPNNRDDAPANISALPALLEGVLCGSDIDWFQFEMARGDVVDVLVSFPEGVDLDLNVLRANDGAAITSALGDARSNPERLQIAHAEAGTYLLGINRFVRDDERDGDITYQLEIVGRSGGCITNADCSTPEQPICDDGVCNAPSSQVELGETCGRDEDCSDSADFCYEGFQGGQDNLCTLRCRADDDCVALGDDAYCTPISFREASCVPACTSNLDCGAFYVCREGRCEVDDECRLDDDCGSGRVCRTTRSGERYCAEPRPQSECGTDIDLEPNGTFANAYELPLDQRVQNLQICNDDDDYFFFVVPEAPVGANPWRLRIETSFRNGTDIDLYVYDERGNALGQSISPEQTTEAVEIDFLSAGTVFARIDQFDSDRLADTTYSVLATLEVEMGRCSRVDDTCAATDPLRLTCDESTGACVPFEGAGSVLLGEPCDSNDDCDAAAQFCSTFDDERSPICTRSCQRDADCDGVGETSCIRFGRGFAVCL